MTTDPTLETARLRLRPFEMTDAPAIQMLLNDPEVVGNMPDETLPFTLEDAEMLVTTSHAATAEGMAYVFAVVRQSNDDLVGYCDLELQPDHQRGEIAYWIGRPYWWQGYATEAAKRVVRFGFEELNLNRVYAHVLQRNTASARVLQKAGLQYEGTQRHAVRQDDGFEDLDFYGQIRADYQP
jgi:[ribosomal protein S5]-alanine N-acetyltransferase